MTMNMADVERVEKWAAGYRTLMRGNLDPVVHTACTEESRMGEDEFAFLSIEDVEGLVVIAKRAYEMAMTGDPTANWISHD